MCLSRNFASALASRAEAGKSAASPWDGLHGQIFLGGEAFVRQALARLEGDEPSVEIPAAQKRPPARPLAEFARETADRDQAMARAYASGAYSQAAIAGYFGVHYSTVSRAVRRAAPGSAPAV